MGKQNEQAAAESEPVAATVAVPLRFQIDQKVKIKSKNGLVAVVKSLMRHTNGQVDWYVRYQDTDGRRDGKFFAEADLEPVE